MSHTWSRWVGRLGLLAVVSLVGVSALEAATKKLVHWGWSTRDTRYIRDHWAAMEANSPFTGLTVEIVHNRTSTGKDTGNMLSWMFMRDAYPLAGANMQAAITDLQGHAYTKFLNNFVMLTFSGWPIEEPPSPLSSQAHFFNDSKWTTIVSNVTTIASIAKAAGFRGVLLDPEAYVQDNPTPGIGGLFDYDWQNARSANTFPNYRTKARQRGNEVMTAIKNAFAPQVPVILSVYGWTMVRDDIENKGQTHQTSINGLWIDFLDGFLEAMNAAPAGGHFVDGWEFSYDTTNLSTFQANRTTILNTGGATVPGTGYTYSAYPSLYATYVKAGFGVWPDWYGNIHRREPGWVPPSSGGGVLQTALTNALNTADEYVWIYNEPRGAIEGQPSTCIVNAQNDCLGVDWFPGTYNTTTNVYDVSFPSPTHPIPSYYGVAGANALAAANPAGAPPAAPTNLIIRSP